MGWTRARHGARCGRGSPVCTPARRAYVTGVVRFRFVMSSQLSGPVGNEATSLMPRASARWVAAPAAPLPRRCLRAYPARARAAGGQGQGAGGGGYRYRAGGAMPRDPYRVLDVEMDASQAEIKLAFRQLTKRTHPDVNPSDNAAETFRRINAAYEIVGDAERRRRFDLGNDWEVRHQIFKSCNVEMPIHPRLSLPDLHTQHITIIAGHGRGMDARGGDESTRAGCRVQSKLTGCREGPKLAKETRRNGRGGFRRRQTTSGTQSALPDTVQTGLGGVVQGVDGGAKRGRARGVRVLRRRGAHAREAAHV